MNADVDPQEARARLTRELLCLLNESAHRAMQGNAYGLEERCAEALLIAMSLRRGGILAPGCALRIGGLYPNTSEVWLVAPPKKDDDEGEKGEPADPIDFESLRKRIPKGWPP